MSKNMSQTPKQVRSFTKQLQQSVLRHVDTAGRQRSCAASWQSREEVAAGARWHTQQVWATHSSWQACSWYVSPAMSIILCNDKGYLYIAYQRSEGKICENECLGNHYHIMCLLSERSRAKESRALIFVAAARYKENISWMPLHLDIPYIIYQANTRGSPGETSHRHNNTAREASAFLQFIAEYYDCLPEVRLHNCPAHHPCSLDTTNVQKVLECTFSSVSKVPFIPNLPGDGMKRCY